MDFKIFRDRFIHMPTHFLSRAAKSLSWWTGVLYLSAFVLNTGLLWFLIRKAGACSFYDVGIILVRCGEGDLARFLDVFLLYFSPLVAPVIALNWRMFFFEPFLASEFQYRLLFIFFFVSFFVIFSSLFVLRKMVKGFLIRRHDREAGKHAWIILAIILIPALLSFSYRLYLLPPNWSGMTMHVDFWHGQFDVPRGEMTDWNVLPRPRPERKPAEYAGKLTRWWKVVPYINFNYPITPAIGDNAPDETVQVQVNPHHEARSREMMQAEREKFLAYRLSLKSEKDDLPIYPAEPLRENGWEIYKANYFYEDVFQDIYVARKNGTIENLLYCTPSHACAVKTRFSWASYPCEATKDCGSCKKICMDVSQGTGDYDIRYTFDKRSIENYPAINREIKNFIAKYYTAY
ncbi:MAG: hypothetical protein DI586_00290 [Micavibrio aeruginosavorus]|uniref:Uncharacterized protein n=1 Tax=Micavibrio aeruginosavorus TaxID=349221 RepID=A0A2W5HV36_9BACT|nr:MAG: hypothetical protein DI586_00290 [Micavibrio aeruginosavorus]